MRSLSAHQFGMSASSSLCASRCEQGIFIAARSKLDLQPKCGNRNHPAYANFKPPGDFRVNNMDEKGIRQFHRQSHRERWIHAQTYRQQG
jgi:hypothetical protein